MSKQKIAAGYKGQNEWKGQDDQPTSGQLSYLKTLCEETGQKFDSSLTKAEASVRINELLKLKGGKPRS